MGKRWEPRGTVQVRGRIELPRVGTIAPRSESRLEISGSNCRRHCHHWLQLNAPQQRVTPCACISSVRSTCAAAAMNLSSQHFSSRCNAVSTCACWA